jgi:crotonobetainyl-CoA:carnitine CoA-transferase CaiB-like acyl-CoA transferase
LSAAAGVAPRALEGLRVLDLTRYIPGPYCTQLLADLGADVVKVEPPSGDPTRRVPPDIGGDSVVHAALNRGKRSIVVDLRAPDGPGVVQRLARRADVLVETFRPGVLARRGLGEAELRAANPRLVYCSISGYGQDGPLALRAGHDIDYAALGGFLGTNRGGDGRPVLPGTQVADMTGGLLAVIAVLAALQRRERTGRGQHLDVSLFEGVLALMTVPAARTLAGGDALGELGGRYACYKVYRCADGRELAVGALEPKFWETLCVALGLPERIPRQWEDGAARDETVAVFARRFAEKDRAAWLRELAEVETCVEPVLELDEALTQAQVRARRGLLRQTIGVARAPTVASPMRCCEPEADAGRAVPGLGQHTDDVLEETGLSAAEISALRQAGAVA